MEDILFKRAEAIEEVKMKLDVFADIMINGYMTIMERVPSFSTSILIMPEGNGSGIGIGEKVTQAIKKEESEHSFIKEYSAIISSLSAKQQEIINNRYFNGYKIRDFEVGNDKTAGDKRIYSKLNEIYSLIACMDINIDFSFDDYVDAKLEDKRSKSEKNKINKIKERTIMYLRTNLYQTHTEDNQLCTNIINLIPEPEKSTMLDYFTCKKKDFSSYEYRKIARAIYTFAYIHPKIEMDEELFEIILKRSGAGWKKYKEEVEKQSSYFSWKKTTNE